MTQHDFVWRGKLEGYHCQRCGFHVDGKHEMTREIASGTCDALGSLQKDMELTQTVVNVEELTERVARLEERVRVVENSANPA